MLFKRMIFLFLIILSWVSVSVGDSPDIVSNLKKEVDYVQFALCNNPSLKASFENWQNKIADIAIAKSLPDPQFGYTYYIEEVETRVGPQKNKFSLRQMFPWFGTLEARGDKRAALAKAAFEEYQFEIFSVKQSVKEAFYEYLYVVEAGKIAKDNLDLISHLEAVARSKYRTALIRHPDLIRAQIELAKLDDVYKSLMELRAPKEARLIELLNLNDNVNLPEPQADEMSALQTAKDILVENALSNNPLIKKMQWQIRAAEAEKVLASKKQSPDFTVGVDWIQTGRAINDGVKDSGKDPVMLAFNLYLPIWGEKNRSITLKAETQKQQMIQQKISVENAIISQLELQLYQYKDSQRKFDLYNDVLQKKAEELLTVSIAAYKSGQLDFSALLESQKLLLEYELEKIKSFKNSQQSLAEIEKITGLNLL